MRWEKGQIRSLELASGAAAGSAWEPAPAEEAGAGLFVVSRDLALQAQLRAHLRALRRPVCAFESAADLLHRWRRSLAQPQPFNPLQILFDVDTAGLEDFRRLCAQPWMGGRERVAMARETSRAARQAAFEAGATGLLPLPYLAPELLACLQGDPQVPRAAAAAPEGLRVLIADFDPWIREMLCHHAARQGWRPTPVADGEQAETALTTGAYHLAALEVLLPHRGGLEVLQAARQRRAPTRVLLFSARSGDDVQLDAFRLGADDFLPKPINPDLVIARLHRMLAWAPLPAAQPRPPAAWELAGLGHLAREAG